jgi:hypothetical protein
MKNIEQLQRLHFLLRMGSANWNSCIDWAIERLQNDEEQDDLDIVMLAAASREDEVHPLVSTIIERYIGIEDLNDELAAGKYIVELHVAYKGNAETAITLEPKLWKLFNSPGYPTWLGMLCRNCEYATDIDVFEKPFEDEFEYIARLWSNSKSLPEFAAVYDHKVSSSHDVAGKIVPNQNS